MEFVIAKQALEKALSQLSRIAIERSTYPILSNVMIVAHPDNWVSFTATNVSVDLRIVLDAQVKTSGVTTVLARHLDRWVSGARADEIKFRLTDKRLNLSASKDTSHVAFLSADDFPAVYFRDDDQPIAVIPAKELQKGIKQSLVAASNSDERANLYAVLIEIFAGDEIVLVGTDGYRISKKVINTQTFGQTKLLISRPFIAELEKVLANQDGDVKIVADERRAQFIFGNTCFATLLVDANYPAYEKAFDEVNYKTWVEVSTKELLKALNTVRVFTKDDDSPFVEFNTNTTQIFISNDSLVPSEYGTSESVIDAEIKGDEWKRAYNAAMMAEALGVFDDNKIYLLNGIRSATITQNGVDVAIESSFMYLADAIEHPSLIQAIAPRS